MKHYHPLRRIVSFVLCLVLLCGLGLSAHAADFQWPQSYWAIQKAWNEAAASNDPDKIIAAGESAYDTLMTYEPHVNVYGYLDMICISTSLAYEVKGDLNGAIKWLERQQTLCQWLTDHGTDRKDTLLNIAPRLAFLRTAVNPVIYALSDDAESPYTYGPRHGTWLGSTATEVNAKSGESAVLAYIHFFDGYSVQYWLDYFDYHCPTFHKAATEGGVIELAWNFSPENTDSVRKVLDSANDAYIDEGLKAISQLNATVLLRVGAEMNVWTQDCDPATFREAYRKIADKAHKYSNIQMSWSPGDVGSRDRTWDDYWPGDEYVDWVGMSSYRNSGTFYSQGTTTPATYSMNYKNYIYNDAYYGVGVYSTNPLAPIKSLVDFAAAHGKPVMISECGSGYYDKRASKDQTDFAVKTLTTFYSYVNMIYPQVKAVFYFNDVAEASPTYSYRLDRNAAVNSAYDQVTGNGSYLSFGQTECMNWETLDNTTLSSGDGKLTLATYALIPGSSVATTSVHYYVDGQWKTRSDTAPYTYNLDLSTLSAGKHTIQAVVGCTDGDRTVQAKTVEYTIEVPGNTATIPTIVSTGLNPEASGTAYASTQTALVDGTAKQFQYYALRDDKGGETNYVKLRDLADVLDGTAAQFNVTWTEEAGVGVQTKTAYSTRTGQEGKTPYSGDRTYQKGAATTLVNGVPVPLQAFVLTDDQGGDHTYYKLRDLGQALGFNVGYDPATDSIYIETDKPYSSN